tara:strand:- start:741 stop:1031 length:291 start_codon:yes stop_codon:yes gene_type:complete
MEILLKCISHGFGDCKVQRLTSLSGVVITSIDQLHPFDRAVVHLEDDVSQNGKDAAEGSEGSDQSKKWFQKSPPQRISRMNGSDGAPDIFLLSQLI